jgi:hypothetical protein
MFAPKNIEKLPILTQNFMKNSFPVAVVSISAWRADYPGSNPAREINGNAVVNFNLICNAISVTR